MLNKSSHPKRSRFLIVATLVLGGALLSACKDTASPQPTATAIPKPAPTQIPAPTATAIPRPAATQMPAPTATAAGLVGPTNTPAAEALRLPDTCSPESADSSPYANLRDGYCLSYPASFRVGDVLPGIFNLYGPPMDQSLEPLAAGMSIVVHGPAGGRSLAEIVDEVVAEFEDLPTTRTLSTLGGEPAEIVEGLPGRTGTRKMFVIHGETIYSLSAYPWDEAFPQVAPQVEELWEAVTGSFTFLP